MRTDDYRTQAQYQFGHGEPASRRLAVLSRVFRSSTESFLREAAGSGARQILDLGCGPGHTTRLLAELFADGAVTGVDIAAEFLAEAERTSEPGLRYVRRDVTSERLPSSPADLIFCRFLLSHLQRPGELVARWGAELAPGGVLLIEEVEAIHPNAPPFERYLTLVAAMLAEQGAELYVGAEFAGSPDPDGLERCFDRVYELPVARRDAALMFSLNVPSWKDSPFIQQRCSAHEIATLEAELQRLAATDGGEQVSWQLRQIAWRRR